MIQAPDIKDILFLPRTIAIVGAKDKPEEEVYGIGSYLLNAGYTIIPVHPKNSEVWGLKAYRALSDIPVPVDIVDVFRLPEFCATHAEEAARLEHIPKVFWMQPGIESPEAKKIAEAAGMVVIENKCIKIEHRNVFK